MADVKISQLPAATTPVDGTEVLPIVQSATTKQVSIANLTAGRAVSALSLSLTNALPVTSGGTGINAAAQGSLLSATGTNTFSATTTPTLGFAGTAAGTLGLSGSGSGVVTLATASGAAGTWTMRLPTTGGTNNYLLKTDGSGNTDWVNPTALGIDLDVGTTAITGGTTTRVLYNNAGVLGEYSSVPTSVGGTGLSGATPFTANGLLYASSTSALATSSNLTYNGTTLSVTAGGATAFRAYSGGASSFVTFELGRTTTDAYISIAGTTNNFLTGSAAGDLTINNNTGKIMLGYSSTPAITVTTGNYVGIRTTTPTYGFDALTDGFRLANTGAGANILFIGRDRANDYGFVQFQSSPQAVDGWTVGGLNAFSSLVSSTVQVGNLEWTKSGAGTDNKVSFKIMTHNGVGLQTSFFIDANCNAKVINSIGVGNTTPSTSGYGIAFPANQSASSDANTLDDYEEGTWTPTFTNTGSPVVGYSNYTKIGRVVTVQLRITSGATITANSSRFSLPFTSAATIFAAGTFTTNTTGGGFMETQGNSVDCYFATTTASAVAIITVIYITAT